MDTAICYPFPWMGNDGNRNANDPMKMIPKRWKWSHKQRKHQDDARSRVMEKTEFLSGQTDSVCKWQGRDSSHIILKRKKKREERKKENIKHFMDWIRQRQETQRHAHASKWEHTKS